MPGTSLRDARAADAAAVCAFLYRTWHDTYDRLHGFAKIEAITKRWHAPEAILAEIGDAKAEFLLAERAGRIAGHALAAVGKDGRGKLSRLYVDPDLQGRGVGRLLLDEVCRRLDGRCASLWLEVDLLGAQAIAFYEKAGFVETGRTSSCGSDSDIPALIMQRDLRPRGEAG